MFTEKDLTIINGGKSHCNNFGEMNFKIVILWWKLVDWVKRVEIGFNDGLKEFMALFVLSTRTAFLLIFLFDVEKSFAAFLPSFWN